MDFYEIEEKWNNEWLNAKIFEAEPNDKKPFMIVFAFPYVNSPFHMGHAYTYSIADTVARYKRMQGYNVLFPAGFHATGTPILSFAKRIKAGDKGLIDEFKNIFNIPDEDIKKMIDPLFLANYFIEIDRRAFKDLGFSIDFRREFVSIDQKFSKFVEWQFDKLNEAGLLTKGLHWVGWCPNENNAVSMHDTSGDKEPEIEEITGIKFKVKDRDFSFLCATFRPETLFGVTNLFINKNAKYVICTIENEKVCISEEASKRLSYQFDIRDTQTISNDELLTLKAINPINNSEVPILHASFVDPKNGTGVVMSVPAHAPFDYYALYEENKRYDIKPIKVLEINNYEIPAKKYIEMVDEEDINKKLEIATEKEYKEEAHKGIFSIEPYKGLNESEVREKIKEDLEKSNNAIPIYIIENAPIYCRCGAEVVVKKISDQWFLDYGNQEWKKIAKELLDKMQVLPESARKDLEYTINWLHERAVVRAEGLGTKFPLDNKYIIESLSDSTIYPIFYTFSHLLKDVKPEQLTKSFFDFVILNIGNIDQVSKETGIDYNIIKKSKEEFEYWYKNSYNSSGYDLVYNHLTMYIFNHAIIFKDKREYWPKGIIANGLVLYDGQKMSKSLGNIIPALDIRKKFGADPTRLALIYSSNVDSNPNFELNNLKGIIERLSYIENVIDNIQNYNNTEIKNIDYWLYSKLAKKIKNATNEMEKLLTRDYVLDVLFNTIDELKRYFDRGGSNPLVLNEYISKVLLLMQPIAPHIAEELWHRIGNETFVSLEKWPAIDESMINDKLEKSEEAIDLFIDDVKSIRDMLKRKNREIKKLKIIIASKEKREKVKEYFENRLDDKNIKEAIEKRKDRLDLLRDNDISQDDEIAIFNDAKDYISKKIGVEVYIEREEESKSEKRIRSLPLIPSFELE